MKRTRDSPIHKVEWQAGFTNGVSWHSLDTKESHPGESLRRLSVTVKGVNTFWTQGVEVEAGKVLRKQEWENGRLTFDRDKFHLMVQGVEVYGDTPPLIQRLLSSPL
jgi:hypothetical protein